MAARAGFTALTLGQRTIRADVMSAIALAVLQFSWGDL
jgi:16S rRNA U1498 N3-methylase RsmE